MREGLNSLLTEGFGFMTTIFESIWASGLALFNIAGLFVVTPVVAFYMLLDWDRMVAKVDSWVPREHVATVRAIASDINTSSAGFVRGQGTLSLALGIYYAIGLTITGLNFGILIGLFAGLISFIPYVGSLVGLVLSVGLAIIQFWPDYFMIGAVALVFIVGQFIEGNILHPLLVGKSVGLHPVWLMFALFAFGALFGFVGLLIAVPAAAAVAVLVRFALNRYLESPLYKGHADDPPVVVEKAGAQSGRAEPSAQERCPRQIDHGSCRSTSAIRKAARATISWFREANAGGGRADRPLAGLAVAAGRAGRAGRLGKIASGRDLAGNVGRRWLSSAGDIEEAGRGRAAAAAFFVDDADGERS